MQGYWRRRNNANPLVVHALLDLSSLAHPQMVIEVGFLCRRQAPPSLGLARDGTNRHVYLRLKRLAGQDCPSPLPSPHRGGWPRPRKNFASLGASFPSSRMASPRPGPCGMKGTKPTCPQQASPHPLRHTLLCLADSRRPPSRRNNSPSLMS